MLTAPLQLSWMKWNATELKAFFQLWSKGLLLLLQLLTGCERCYELHKKKVGIPALSIAVAISLLFPADKMVFPSPWKSHMSSISLISNGLSSLFHIRNPPFFCTDLGIICFHSCLLSCVFFSGYSSSSSHPHFTGLTAPLSIYANSYFPGGLCVK